MLRGNSIVIGVSDPLTYVLKHMLEKIKYVVL